MYSFFISPLTFQNKTMRHTTYLTLFLLGVSFACNSPSENSNVESPATVYFGGDIITMEGDTPEYVEALVEKDGKILFVGSSAEAMKEAGPGHQMIDLEGKTLVPGFIDGHAHFYNFGSQAVTANLLASPDGNVNDIPSLIETLKTWYTETGVDKTNGWIFGMGFDDAVLKENRFPTRQDLDLANDSIPVMVSHISGHFAVVNTKGLEVLGITESTPNPEGGIIRREADGKSPNGVLEELAAIPSMLKVLTPASTEIADYYLDKGQEMAASYGYTTAQEGRAMVNHELLASYAERGKLKLDVVSYIDYSYPQYMETKWNSKEYNNHYRIGGLKLTLDGSPQGRTAWRTMPYIVPPDGQKEGYSGYPAIPEDSEVQKIVDLAYENNWQLLAHTNADAAADQLIKAVSNSAAKYGNEDRRTVLIHGQLIRYDQLDSLAKYDMVASFFPMHTFYWGDWYKVIIGPEAAQKISPIKSALNKGIHVTSHTDAPVALPNLMMILWTTVNRLSRSGTVIGENEKLSTYEAMQCITSWSAWQHFEEGSKGTLSPGKLADLVILDQNPLKADPSTIKDIQVMETIKEGKSIFKRE